MHVNSFAPVARRIVGEAQSWLHRQRHPHLVSMGREGNPDSCSHCFVAQGCLAPSKSECIAPSLPAKPSSELPFEK